MIFFDLDGVARDLELSIFGKRIDKWVNKVDGVDFYEWVENHPVVLTDSKPTEYYNVIQKISPCTFLSCQPENWRKYTDVWIEKHFPTSRIFYVSDSRDKLSLLKDDDLLIEDYPFYDDYSKIVLLTYTYNSHIKDVYKRIDYPIELEYFLEKINRCVVNPVLSRVCEKGTKCCGVYHRYIFQLENQGDFNDRR